MSTWCRQFLKSLASTTQFAWWADHNNQVKRTRIKNIHYTGGRWKVWELWQGNPDLEWNDWGTPESKGWLQIIEMGGLVCTEHIKMMQLKTNNQFFFAGWPSSGWHHHHIWKGAGFCWFIQHHYLVLYNIYVFVCFFVNIWWCFDDQGVDFTMPFMNLGVTILYKKPTKKASGLFPPPLTTPSAPSTNIYTVV